MITTIFATPVSISKLRYVTEDEFAYIGELGLDSIMNLGNDTSRDNYVLEKQVLKTLKEEIQEKINIYFKEVYQPANDCKAYITQSWVNWTERGDYHHAHNHSNSFISGVYYVSAINDKFTALKDDYQAIEVEPKTSNIYNSRSRTFRIDSGDLILFPSNMKHTVPPKDTKGTRISIAFNTFIKGEISKDQKGLRELII